MYEYGLTHNTTGERNVIYGYSFKNALERAHLNGDDWIVDYAEYID